jgi:trehalose/maltose transport system permease protein
MKARRIAGRTLFYLLIAAIIVYTVFPFYWAIVSSLKAGSALFQVEFWPANPAWTTMPGCSGDSPSHGTS